MGRGVAEQPVVPMKQGKHDPGDPAEERGHRESGGTAGSRICWRERCLENIIQKPSQRNEGS